MDPYKYHVEEKTHNIYTKVENVRYVLFKNFKYNENIKIFHENKEVKFEIISKTENELKIDMKRSYLVESLLFIIDTNEKYKISFYNDINFKNEIIYKEIENEKIFSANKEWITDKTVFVRLTSEINYPVSDLTKITSIMRYCRYREIYVYKYEIEREYYDNNYYSNVDGYIKDIDDYKVYYKGEPITNTIEIINEKIIKEPQIEYVYIEKEPETIKNEKNELEIDSSNKTKENTCSNKIETKIIEKEILKTPKRNYIIIFSLIGTIILLIIILLKKCHIKYLS